MSENYEIERKYLIKCPDMYMLEKCANGTDIVQTYLMGEKGTTERVRKRGNDNGYVFTHTLKKRVSDMRRIEHEREIFEDEYLDLLKRADPGRNTIYKKRYCLDYMGQMFEIDIFPFWSDRAIMEIELLHEEQDVDFPPEIEIIREITNDRRYTNASLAREIPKEEL